MPILAGKFGAVAAQAVGDPGMFRTVFSKIVQNGRQILAEILQKQAPKETREVFRVGLENQPKCSTVVPQVSRLGNHGESVLSRYLARSVTRNLAGEMRRKFALRSQGGSWSIFGGARIQGSRLSLYAFVGVGLAAGNQQWQRAESEGFDSVCDQIRVRTQEIHIMYRTRNA